MSKYPADDTAHNGLAVQYFYTLNFKAALDEGAVLLDIYPGSVMGRSNYALYAMYATDFATAVVEAEKVRELDPTYFKAWLPRQLRRFRTVISELQNPRMPKWCLRVFGAS